MHIGVFILLLLSGERNFGVRLNKPYTATVPMDIPVFSGSHADLLITVFHKIITTGHQRLQPLFDCLLTILVNGEQCINYFWFIDSNFLKSILVSPYLKTLSMVASVKLLHLLEAFSTPWFLYSAPNNHHLVFFLLEIFNNIIQYQFDGNSNLVYTIIRKRQIFHALANLPTDSYGISKCLSGRRGGSRFHRPSPVVVVKAEEEKKKRTPTQEELDAASDEGDTETEDNKSETNSIVESHVEPSMEGSRPAQPAEPGTLNATLLDTPDLGLITEKESAHPSSPSIVDLVGSLPGVGVTPTIGVTEQPAVEEEKSQLPLPSPSAPNDVQSQSFKRGIHQRGSIRLTDDANSSSAPRPSVSWHPSSEWVLSWQKKLPLQTIMRMLQVLVPQVEKICIDKYVTAACNF